MVIPAEDKQPCKKFVQCLNEYKIHDTQLWQQSKAGVPGYEQHCGCSRLAWLKKILVVRPVTWVLLNRYEGYRTCPMLSLAVPAQGTDSVFAARGRLLSCARGGGHGYVFAWQQQGTPWGNAWTGAVGEKVPAPFSRLIAEGGGWLAEVCDTLKPSQVCQPALVKALTASPGQVCCNWQSPTEHTVSWEFLLLLCLREFLFSLSVKYLF